MESDCVRYEWSTNFLRDTKETVTDETEFVADSSVSGMKPDIEIAERGFNTEWYVR